MPYGRDKLLIESIAAESAKFTAPILLVHGLWGSAAVWRRFTGYLAHRGWNCRALNLRGHGGSDTPLVLGAVRFADYLDDVRQAMAACETPPVLLGHDIGGLLALHAAPLARAVVALAPLVPQPLRSPARAPFTGLRTGFAMWRARPLPPPRGTAGRRFFGPRTPAGATVESGTVLRQLSRDDLRFPAVPAVPTLIMAAQADLVSPVEAVERLATYAGATLRQVPEVGHGLPWEDGWEQRVGEIHRWLIQQLGEDLLAITEEDEQP